MYAMMTTSSGGYGQGIRVFGNGGAGHLHIIEIGPAGHEGRIALDRAALEDLHATIGRYLSPLHEARLGELKAQPLEEDEASRTEHLGWAVRVPGNNANRDSNFVPRGSVGLGSRLWTDEDEAQREAAAWREDGYEAAVVEVVVPGPVELAACEELLRELANQASASVDEYVAEGRGGDRAGAAIAKARGFPSWEAAR